MPKLSRRMQSRAEHVVAAEWNDQHPVGTAVRYWRSIRAGEGEIGRTRAAASVLNYAAVVWIEGLRGCIALDHVEAL